MDNEALMVALAMIKKMPAGSQEAVDAAQQAALDAQTAADSIDVATVSEIMNYINGVGAGEETPSEPSEPTGNHVSGNLVSINTASSEPLKSCKVNVRPNRLGSSTYFNNINKINLYVSNKNLIDIGSQDVQNYSSGWNTDYTYNTDGFSVTKTGGSANFGLYFPVPKNVVCTLSFKHSTTGSNDNLKIVDSKDPFSESVVDTLTITNELSSYQHTFTSSSGFLTLYVTFPSSSNGSTVTIEELQIEAGSSATSYEQFNGNTYKLSLNYNLNFVAGDYDFISGELWNRYNYRGLSSSDTWEKDDNVTSGGLTRFYTNGSTDMMKGTSIEDGFCNALPIGNIVSQSPCVVFGYGNDSVVSFLTNDLDLSSFTSWVNNNNPYIIYPRATQILNYMQLFNISSYSGSTFIWSDAGDVDVTY